MITGIATSGLCSPARGPRHFGKVTANFEASAFGTTIPRGRQSAFLVAKLWVNLIAPFPPFARRPRAVESALEDAERRVWP